MKNKIKLVLFVLIILSIGVLNITLKDNGAYKIKRHKQNSLAIMIKEDGSTEYVKSSSKGIPIEGIY